jgi:hypothetical protein
MRLHLAIMAIVAGVTFLAVRPHAVAADDLPGICRGAPEVKVEDSGTEFKSESRYSGGRSYYVQVPVTWTRVTYYNYRNVTDLTYTHTESPVNGKSDTYGFPAYLLQAYDGDISAIEQDLKAGFLRNRGPC